MNTQAKRKFIFFMSIPIFGILFFFGLTMTLLVGDVYRLTAMSIGAALTPGVTALLYPLFFWRPYTSRKLIITIAVLVASYTVITLLVFSGSTLPTNFAGSYGLFNVFLYLYIPALLFEVASRIERKQCDTRLT